MAGRLLSDLFSKPEGWAVILSGAALLLYWGQSAKQQQANLFQISRFYDRRNSTAYSLHRDWLNNPFDRAVASLPIRARSINQRAIGGRL